MRKKKLKSINIALQVLHNSVIKVSIKRGPLSEDCHYISQQYHQYIRTTGNGGSTKLLIKLFPNQAK